MHVSIFCIVLLPNPSFLSVMMVPSLTFIISEVGDFCNNQLHRLLAIFYLEGNSVNMGKNGMMSQLDHMHIPAQ